MTPFLPDCSLSPSKWDFPNVCGWNMHFRRTRRFRGLPVCVKALRFSHPRRAFTIWGAPSSDSCRGSPHPAFPSSRPEVPSSAHTYGLSALRFHRPSLPPQQVLMLPAHCPFGTHASLLSAAKDNRTDLALSLTYKNPIPFGPWILCPLTAYQSSSFSAGCGIFRRPELRPRKQFLDFLLDYFADRCNILHSSDFIVHIHNRYKSGFSVIACSSSSRLMRPWLSTESLVTSNPISSRYAIGAATAGCSIWVVIRCFPLLMFAEQFRPAPSCWIQFLLR